MITEVCIVGRRVTDRTCVPFRITICQSFSDEIRSYTRDGVEEELGMTSTISLSVQDGSRIEISIGHEQR